MQVQENIKLVKSVAKAHKGGDFIFASDADEQKKLWSARKEALWSMLALREEGHDVWSTDVAVPISRLPDIIGKQIVKQQHPPVLILSNRDLQERDGRPRPLC